MENKSILDQIITNQQAEEVARLDAIEIIGTLFNELSNRERDVLSRRFGLHGQDKQTLEKIGQVHALTRERIRQIESTGVKKLRQLENLENYINVVKRAINNLLEEHGGFMEREYLLSSLVGFSAGDLKNKAESHYVHKSHLDFIISQLLNEEFEEVNVSRHFKNFYKLKYQSLDHLELLVEELLEEIKKIRKIFTTEDLINLSKGLPGYKQHEEKFQAQNNMAIMSVYGTDLAKENLELLSQNKALFSLLKAAKMIDQNKFGHWGVSNWREIKPKTINDKIYLILKNYGKPMHFAQIADEINKLGFDKKKANVATVHNELILDEKYILVGRGLYGLKEWGYSKGTVVDIIEQILKDEQEALTRDQIIEKVLDQRLVKKATINLVLMNREKFERTEGGKYKLKI